MKRLSIHQVLSMARERCENILRADEIPDHETPWTLSLRAKIATLKEMQRQARTAELTFMTDFEARARNHRARMERKNARESARLTLRGHRITCRVCGCTETNACPGGCSWVEPDLCSACVKHKTRNPKSPIRNA